MTVPTAGAVESLRGEVWDRYAFFPLKRVSEPVLCLPVYTAIKGRSRYRPWVNRKPTLSCSDLKMSGLDFPSCKEMLVTNLIL